MNPFRVGTEEMHGDILLTRVERKPPTWKAETSDSKGQPVICALQKAPKGSRGFNVILPGGNLVGFATKRIALKFIAHLEAEGQPPKSGTEPV